MTTLRAISPSGSLTIGGTSSNSTVTYGSRTVVYAEFTSLRTVPLAKTSSLDSLLTQAESKPQIAAHLQEARRNLAKEWYAEYPNSLSALRLSAGMSQVQLADKVGTSQSHIARIERGQTDPTTDIVARVADALSVSAVEAFAAIRLQRERHEQ